MVAPAYVIAVAAAVAAFPAFPQHSLSIVAPADGAIIYGDPNANSTATLTLRYALSAPDTSRLCLELLRGPMRYYRGPLLQRDESELSPYAKGCYAPGQPVVLQRLSVGSFRLLSTAEGADGAVLARASTFFGVAKSAEPPPGELPPAAEFAPSYEWATVPEGFSVPAGLEISLTLHDASKVEVRRARIPQSWRLQLWLGEADGFGRVDVQRGEQIGQVEAALSSFLRQRRRHGHGHGHGATGDPGATAATAAAAAATCVRVELHEGEGGPRLPSAATVETADLFSRRGGVVAKLAACSAEEAAAAEEEAHKSRLPRPTHKAAAPSSAHGGSEGDAHGGGAEVPLLLRGPE